MQPSLIKIKKPIEKKIKAWINGVEKTGILRSSAIPTLDDIEKYSDIKSARNILIESIEFNEHVEPKKICQMIESGIFKLDKTLANLNFMNQNVDCKLLEVLLTWLGKSAITIKHCNLANISVCSKAWRFFVDWLIRGTTEVQSLELGKVKMNLSRVKDLVNILQEANVGLSRLGLAESQWTFCEMKAFLWMGGFVKSKKLTRLSLGDSVLCANSRRLLIEHIAQESSTIQVFSSGIVELSEHEIVKLFGHMQTRQSNLLSLVLSNQTLGKKSSEQLAKVISQSDTLRHLAVINCWLDKEALEGKMRIGKVPNIYLETITAGQIQTMTEMFIAKGYEIEREVSRHRIKLKLPNK
ncbi:MAG: hypothetical protein VX737_03650 [Pseudomonadota bacterium]|nr:hypothetical protein [Pseudomonadota bacterium]